jgi:cobalt transporter subunit CbtA
MLRRIFVSALAAGVIAGVLVSLAQSVSLVPMLLEAERYEMGIGLGDPGDHQDGGIERTLSTLMANVVTGVGFALMLAGGFVLRGGDMNWRRGIVWGLAGYAAFTLLPGLGLPPQVPGAERPDLYDSQDWWLATAVLSVGGIWLIAFSKSPWKKAMGVAVLVAPHLIGAPRPDEVGSSAPQDLAAGFAVAVFVVSALFWIALGGLTGYFFGRSRLD